MRALYTGLIAITFGSTSLYLSKYFFDVRLWDDFVTGYTLVLVAYTCYLFALLFVHDLRPRRYPSYAGGKIAVLIPVFNEEPELVGRSIRAVVEAEGEKQVIVVDDGSTNGVQSHLRLLADELGFRLHEFPENAGSGRRCSTRRSGCSTTTRSTSSRSTATPCSTPPRWCGSSSRCCARRSARRPATCSS